jgi:hypothetical protein
MKSKHTEGRALDYSGPRHILYFVLPVILALYIGGCATNAQQNVAFAEESLTAAIHLTTTALQSKIIDVEQAKAVRVKLKEAETALASARRLVIEGKVGAGNDKLAAARAILVEVNRILIAREP